MYTYYYLDLVRMKRFKRKFANKNYLVFYGSHKIWISLARHFNNDIKIISNFIYDGQIESETLSNRLKNINRFKNAINN